MNYDNQAEKDKATTLAGAGAGVLAGAQVGTALLPIPVVGTFTGALVGGLIGTKIGKKVGGAILDAVGTGSTARSQNSGSSQSAGSNLQNELERLAKLHCEGVLSDEEFKAAKAKILGL